MYWRLLTSANKKGREDMTWEEIASRPMTSEEAIKQLKEFIILHQEQHGWDVSTIKALEKAVKALEQNAKYRKEAKRWKNKALGQKPCEDAVSRSQALKELKESAKHHANDSREEVLLRRDRDIIRALPSITPTQEPVLDKISKEIDDLRNYSYLFTDMIFDEVQRIIDKYKE